MMNFRKINTAAAAVLLSISLTACSSGKAAEKVGSASTASAAAAASAEPTVETTGPDIGTRSDSSLTQRLYVENHTGRKITGFAIKVDGEENYGDNMMTEGDTVENGECRAVYYTEEASDVTATASSDASLSGALINEAYDLQLTFEDGSQEEVKNFPIGNAEEVSLAAASAEEGGFIYLTYTDINGEEVSTHDAEKADYDAAQKAAADAAAAQKAAEEAAAQQAAEEAAAAQAAAQAQQQQSQQYSSSSQNQTYSDSTYSGSSAGDTTTQSGGSADSGCLGDGALFN
jgi:colicin import membrane protein